MILVCKGTCTAVVPPLKGQGGSAPVPASLLQANPEVSVLHCSQKHSVSCILHANVCLPFVVQIHTAWC